MLPNLRMTLPLIYKGIIHFHSGARKQISIFGDLLVSVADMVSAADTKGITMQKLSTAPFRTAKKTERKVGKGKGKETYPGYFCNPFRSAHGCVRVRCPEPTCSYDFAEADRRFVVALRRVVERSKGPTTCHREKICEALKIKGRMYRLRLNGLPK